MSPKTTIATLLVLVAAISASGHDLFLKLNSYFLKPNSKVTVRLMNGTFDRSDGTVSRERLQNVSLIRPAAESPIEGAVTWRDEGKTTFMEIQTGHEGTYLVGVSTKPREISLKAAEFNDYLQHDGLPDTLAERRIKGELDKDARERYSKHSRSIFQVGNHRSDDYKRSLNYPVEIIPQQNPYGLKVGQTIDLLCTRDGKPLVNQFVMAGWESSDGKVHTLEKRTDSLGVARIKLAGAGKWYVKFIHMTSLNQSDLDYESSWATLTFEIKGKGR